jgi:hypothetical protein
MRLGLKTDYIACFLLKPWLFLRASTPVLHSPFLRFPRTKPLGFLTAENAKDAEQTKAWL